jgi:hypothetical protein
MKGSIKDMTDNYWVDQAHVYSATKGGMGKIEVDRKLYIMSHGNSILPIFQTKTGRWTAEHMAKLLVKNGLKKEHRDIELIVCNAGASVSNVKTYEERLPQHKELMRAEGNKQLHAKLLDEWTKKVGKSKPTQYFGKVEENPQMLQVLPLAAQFAGALNTAGFKNFRITCYRLPVSRKFASEPAGKISLDTTGMEPHGKWGDSREDIVEKYKVEWR